MIEFTLIRIALREQYTIGRLLLNGKPFCDTLEDRVRDTNRDGDLDDPGEGKVPGSTAIPYGRYRVVLTHSPKFGRRLPLLMNVPHFEGIRIHRGNKAGDTAGCILVGENAVKGALRFSAYWEERVVDVLRSAEESRQEVFINVIDREA